MGILTFGLLYAFCLLQCFAPPPVYPPSRGGSGGTGGVLTNNTVAAVIANFYTNSTPHWIDGEARLGTSTAGRIQAAVTNSDNTLFFHYQNEVAVVGATSNTISFKVPPGGWWKFIGLTTTATDGSQQLLYTATNGSVSFATSAGNAATVTDGVYGAGLAAGSHPINGQPITNLLSALAQLESGSAKTSRSPGGYATLGAYGTNNTSSSFVIGAGNQGIVKTLFCHLDVGSTGGVQTNINSLDLLIYTDGTATGNLTARIKVADLLNCYYRYPTTNWTIRSHSRFLSFYTDPLSERSGFPLYHFTLNLPMPFTNGISFKLTNSVAGTTWTHGYFQAQYELKSLSPELFSTRAYITNIHGAMSSGTSNFLFSATGASEIVGFQIGLSNSSLSDAAQGLADKGLAFYIDSTVFTYDLDDWLENTYAGVYGEFLAQEVGWPHNDYDATLDGGGAGAQEAYRWLPQDSIRSTNSMVVYFDGNVVMESAYYNFFYYKR